MVCKQGHPGADRRYNHPVRVGEIATDCFTSPVTILHNSCELWERLVKTDKIRMNVGQALHLIRCPPDTQVLDTEGG
jgi:hypothetical protein